MNTEFEVTKSEKIYLGILMTVFVLLICASMIYSSIEPYLQIKGF